MNTSEMNTSEMSASGTGAFEGRAIQERAIQASEAVSPAMRCVAVIDAALPPGHAANAAAVMALTMGARRPQLAGDTLLDRDGNQHPGLIPIGLPVLGAPGSDLPRLREKALAAGLDVVDFPAAGQTTTDYALFQSMMRETAPDEVRYVGVMLYGERKKVSRVVGKYGLLR